MSTIEEDIANMEDARSIIRYFPGAFGREDAEQVTAEDRKNIAAVLERMRDDFDIARVHGHLAALARKLRGSDLGGT